VNLFESISSGHLETLISSATGWTTVGTLNHYIDLYYVCIYLNIKRHVEKTLIYHVDVKDTLYKQSHCLKPLM